MQEARSWMKNHPHAGRPTSRKYEVGDEISFPSGNRQKIVDVYKGENGEPIYKVRDQHHGVVRLDEEDIDEALRERGATLL